MKKGDMLEADYSRKVLQDSEVVPILVSPLLLRSQNLGQIDIAYLERYPQKHSQKKWVIKIVELKFSQYPSLFQMRRLYKTQDYLSRVLDLESKLEVKFCQKADHSLSF